VRPQSVMLSVLGLYLREREAAVATGSLIDLLGRVGIGEEAVRSTVARMVKRELLERHPVGRKVYVALTPRSRAVLEEGHRRMWVEGAVNHVWDGTWTVVTFTLPDERRGDRHDLRTRLQWSGFGPLQGGVWVAAGPRDVPALLDGLPLAEHVVALSGTTTPPTSGDELVRRAFDLPALASGYRGFLAQWGGGASAGASLPDDLSRQLLLHTEWLSALRHDPHLPVEHLPGDWPAIAAEQVFRELAVSWEASARRLGSAALDLLELR
jgi:phenylacetic acid degradation operon negative regulatory protein